MKRVSVVLGLSCVLMTLWGRFDYGEFVIHVVDQYVGEYS